MFEIVDGRTVDDDGRTPEHGYTISSPCEPNGSGELKSCLNLKYSFSNGNNYDFFKQNHQVIYSTV